MIGTRTYYTLYKKFSNGKIVEAYEVLKQFLTYYTVRIIYNDGEEEIAEGDLEYFNATFDIVENTTWNKYHE